MDVPMEPRVTVAFVPRETVSQTVGMLRTLIKHTKVPFHLIVVTAGYPRKIVDGVRKHIAAVGGRLLDFPAYMTPNEARNAALAATTTDYIVFVDHDVHVDKNWLPPLLSCATETAAAIVSPLIFEFKPLFSKIHMAGGEARIIAQPTGENVCHEKHFEPHKKIAAAKLSRKRKRTELAEFHTVLVDVAWLRSVGGLDPELLSVFEHWDMCITATQSGRDIYLEPKSRVTYVPQTAPTSDDIRWFSVRWSDEWNQRSVDHLCRKYSMSRDVGSLKELNGFLTRHQGHRFLPTRQRLVRLLGDRIGRYVFERYARPAIIRLEKPRVRRDLASWDAQRNAVRDATFLSLVA